MEKNVLRAIDGIALYPLISFGIFGLFFLGLLAYVLVVKSSFIDEMKHLPLADESVAVPATILQKGGVPC